MIVVAYDLKLYDSVFKPYFSVTNLVKSKTAKKLHLTPSIAVRLTD